jgi:hypothetical protein
MHTSVSTTEIPILKNLKASYCTPHNWGKFLCELNLEVFAVGFNVDVFKFNALINLILNLILIPILSCFNS